MSEKSVKKPTIASVATSIAVIEHQVKVLPGIETYLRKLNGSIADTNVKLAKTDSIAKTADARSLSNSSRYDKLTLTLIASTLTALVAIVVIAFQLIGG